MYTLRYALVSLLLLFFGATKVEGQVTDVDFLIKYNPETCLYEACIVIVNGSATTYPQRIQFNAQYTLVVPTGTNWQIDTLFWPKENNSAYTGTIPCLWEFGPSEISPPTQPQHDFLTVFPNLSPPSAYNNLSPGDTVRLFGLSTDTPLDCENEIRPFINGVDPSSLDMPSGGDYSNGFTLGGGAQLYRMNLDTEHPPLPEIEVSYTCAGDVTLNVTPLDSFICQHPYNYVWTGPGFFSTDESPVIPEAMLPISIDGFITDSYGCDTTITIDIDGPATVTSNTTICGAGNVTLQDLSGFGNGTWTLDPSNTVGVSLGGTFGGNATATFDASASGTYLFHYDGGDCDAQTEVTVAAATSVPTIGDNGPLCVGEDLMLTTDAVAGATYAWTGPLGWNSSAQNPVITNVSAGAAGVYSLVVTVGGCPSSPAMTTIVINNAPSTPNASSNSPVCEGENITLSTDFVLGGTYAWTGPNGYSSSDQNPIITNAALADGGTYCVVVTANGCDSAPGCTDVTVNPNPAQPTPSNDGPACEGEDINLSTPFVFGATYSWTGPNGYTSTDQNPVIIGATSADAGSYCVEVTLGTCTSTPGCTTVTIDPTPATPVANNDGPVCEGEDLNLSTDFVPGANYSWTGPNGYTSTDQNPVIMNVGSIHAGQYCVIVTVGGCPSAQGCTDVVVRTKPAAPMIADNGPLCTGEDLMLSTDFVSGATYAWTGPNGFTSSNQNPTIFGATAAEGGLYCLTIEVDGCISDQTCTTITISDTPSTPTVASNSALCEGETLLLDGPNIPGATYTWRDPFGVFFSSQEDPSISNITLAEAGSYCLVVTVNGCDSAPGCTDVVVNPVPSAPVVSSNSPICAGEAITLFTDNIPGATYLWEDPTGTIFFTDEDPVITGPAAIAGTYCLVVTVNGCESPASCTDVVINPTPTAPSISSNTPLCEGDDLMLTAGNVPGAIYNWSGPNGYTSTDQNPILPGVTLAEAGSYLLNISIDGCTSPTISTNVDIFPTPAQPSPVGNGPVCEGDDIFLTVDEVPGANYIWSGPNSFTSFSQNPTISSATALESGTYCVVISLNGCDSAPGCVDVIVNPLPATPVASNNGPICEGEDIELTTDPVVGATYAWTGPNGYTSADQNPIIVGATNTESGMYCVEIIVDGCMSAQGCTDVVVNPIPATPVASNNGPVCEGEDIELTTDPVVGATYAWTGPNGYTSADQNPIITGASLAEGGTYCLTITVDGCLSLAGCTDVVVLPTPATPTASSNSPICEGDDLTLTTDAVAGATYAWTGPDGFTSADQNPILLGATPAASGMYCVTVIVDGCPSLEGCTDVLVNPTPPTPTANNNGPICEGEDLELTTDAVAGATYAWTGPDGFTSADQNPIIVGALPAAAGSYCVTITIDGCVSLEGCTDAVVFPTPATPTASSNSPICEGENIELTTETVTSATYTWTGPDGFTSTDQNPIITSATTAASGTYCVVVTVDGCSSLEGCTDVTVIPTPATPTVSNNGPICEGEDLELTTDAVVGATYAWTGPDGFTSTDQNPIIVGALPAASGSYCLIITVDGCPSLEACTDVLVHPTPPTPIVSNNGPICEGEDIELTADPVAGATYAWTGPNGYTSTDQNPIIVGATPTESGSYCLIITVDGCLSLEACTDVLVHPTPPTPIVSNNGPICEGEDIELTADPVAGATYAWTGPNGYTSTDQNPIIVGATPTESGSYCLIVTVDGCLSLEACTDVLVKPTPATPIVSNNGPICEGEDIELTTDPVAGATYAWTGPNGYTSTDQNPIIVGATPTESGSYCLIITVDGCLSLEACTDVLVKPTPATPIVSNNGPICEDEDIELTADPVAGATYAWTGPNGYTSTDQNPIIVGATPTESGSYCLIITVDGCLSLEACTDVLVKPTPATPIVSNNGPICEGEDIELTADPVAGATYAWTGPNGYTSSDQNPIISNATPTESGSYCLIITVDGCLSLEACTDVLVRPTPPTPTASSNSPVCEEGDLMLTTGAVPGATYSWTGPNGFASNDQNPTITSVTLSAAGNYCVVITIDGCDSEAGCTDVVITPKPVAPTISNNGPICEEENLVLSTDAVFGATYVWTGPNGYTSSQQNPIISSATVNENGTYCLFIIVDGCESDEVCMDVTIKPTPATPIASNNGPICEGDVIGLSTTFVAGATYNWTGPNGYTSSDQNPNISNAKPSDSGPYCVFVTVDGCDSEVHCTDVLVRPTPPTPVVNNNGPICEDENIMLFADNVPGATYSWTGPNGYTSSDQNPIIIGAQPNQSGSYCLVITVDGCDGEASCTDVLVNPTPETPIASSNGPICEGENLEFSATSILNANYNWSGPLGFTSNQQNPNILAADPTHSGTYCVFVTVDGCESEVHCVDVTVKPTPELPIPSNNGPICEGENIELSVETVAGATYSWTGPNGFASSDQNPIITSATPADNGPYCVVITVDGCESVSACTDVTVTPTPNTPIVSNNGPICEDEDIELSANAIPGATYAWTGPNGFNSSDQNPVIASAGLDANGAYCLIVTVDGCQSLEACTDVLVKPTPATPVVSNNGPICEGEDLFLSATDIAGATYAWTGPNGFASSDQNPTISAASPTESGSYCVIVTVDGCESAEACTDVLIKPTPSTPVASNNGPICEDEEIQLTTDPVAGASYAWTGPNGYTSSDQNPIITSATPAQSGDYCLIITVDGCESEASCTNVLVKPTPATPIVSNNGPICEGEDLLLSTDEVTGATYAWTGPNGFASAVQNPTIGAASPTESGSYCVIVTVDGCESAEACTDVLIKPTPSTPVASNNGPICEDEDIQLTTDPVAGASYAWTGPNGYTSSDQNPIITSATPAQSGDYCVIITVDGCESEAGCTNVLVKPTPTTPIASNNGPICEGEDLLLSTDAVAGATYAWTGPNGFVSNLQNITISNATTSDNGQYCVEVTVEGCVSEAGCTDVTVKPTPVTPVVNNNGPICEAEDIELTTDAVAGATYAWSGPNGFTSDEQNPIIVNASPMDGGSYCLVVTVDGCESVVACTDVTVKPNPAIPMASNNGPICNGEDLELTTATVSGADYMWSGPDGFTSSDQNPIISAATTAASGQYCLTVTVDGCVSEAGCTDVVVHPTPPTPNPSNNGPICEGESIELMTETVAGATYRWMGPNGFTSNDQNPSIDNASTSDAGSYCVVITVDGCESASACTDVSVKPTPDTPSITDNGEICEGEDLELSTPAVANATYQWTGPNGWVSNDQNPVIPAASPAENGMYCLVIVIDGCESASACIDVEISPEISAGPDQTLLCEVLSELVVTMDASPTQGGEWSVGGVQPSVTIDMSDSETTTLSNFTEAGIYTFVWSNGVCSDEVQIEITAQPEAGDDQYVKCYVTGSVILGAEGEPGTWTAGNVAGSFDLSPTDNPIATVSNFSDPGIYEFIWTVGDCSDMVVITVDEDCECPIANNLIEGNPFEFCGQSEVITIVGEEASPAGGDYLWQYFNTTDNDFVDASPPNNTKDYTTLILGVGNHRFRRIYSIENPSCADTSNVAVINVSEQPIAGTDQDLLCQNIDNLQIMMNGSGSGIWNQESGPAVASILTNNDPQTMMTVPEAGTYVFSYGENGCFDEVTITITEEADGGPDQTVNCFATGSAIMAAVANPNGSWSWASTPGDFPSFDMNDENTVISGFGQSGDYILHWTVGDCVDEVIITVGEDCACPIGNNIIDAPNPAQYCGQSPAIEITGSVATPDGEYLWEYDGGSGYVLANGTNNGQNYTTEELSVGIHRFRRIYTTTTAPICSDTSNVVEIEVLEQPDAGADQQLSCIELPGGSVTMNGSAIGVWRALDINPGIANIVNNNLSNTEINDFPLPGIYGFILENGICSDTVFVEVSEAVDAGPDQAVECYVTGSAVMAAVSSNGTWSVSSVPTSATEPNIASQNSANTTVDGFDLPGTYVLLWTVGDCSDEVVITVGDDCDCPIAGNNIIQPVPDVYCDTSPTILIEGGDASPGGGTYLWQYFDEAGNDFVDAQVPNNQRDYTTTALGVGTHRFRRVYSIETPMCDDISNEVVIEVLATPNAGVDQNLDCIELPGSIVMAASGDGTWVANLSNPAIVSIAMPDSPTTAMDGFSAAGEYRFTFENGICIDEVIVTVTEEADAGADQNVNCFLTGTASLSASGSGTWSYGSTPNGDQPTFVMNNANTTISGFGETGVYELIWTSNGCTDMITITVDDDCDCPIGNNVITQPDPFEFCDQSENITISGLDAMPGGGAYVWEYSADGINFNEAPDVFDQRDYETGILDVGEYIFRRIYNLTSPACSDTSNTVTVIVYEQPNAGQDQVLDCIELPATVTMSGIGEGTWSSAPGNPSIPNIDMPSAANTEISGLESGVYTFILTNGICVDEVEITVSEAADAGQDQSHDCFETATAVMSASGNGTWSWGTTPNGDEPAFVDNNPNTSISGFAFDGDYHLIWTNEDGCSDEVIISLGTDCNCPIANNIIDQPVPSNFCGGSPALEIVGQDATPAGGSYTWIHSVDGSPYVPAPLTNTNKDYTTTLLSVGTHSYRRIYEVTDPIACIDTSNAVIVIVAPDADAGPDQAVDCYEDGVATMAAMGTGTWSWGTTPEPGNTGPNFDFNDPNATISGFAMAGIYELIWTTDDNCVDEVIITVGDNCACPIDNNTIQEVNPNEFCGLSEAVTIIGSDPTPAGGTFTWEYSFDGGPFLNADPVNDGRDYTTGILGVGEHVFRRVYDIDAPIDCDHTSNEIIIVVHEDANAGPDQTVDCYENESAVMAAEGEGTWSWNSTLTASISPIDSPNATVGGFPSAGTYELIWTTTDGCSDTVIIEVGEDCDCPIVDNTIAQPDPSEFCGQSGVITIVGSDPSPAGGIFSWEYSFDGGAFTSADPINNGRDYETGVLGVGVHVFRRIYTIDSPIECDHTSNTVAITVHEDADAGPDQNVDCFEDGMATMAASGEGEWSWNSALTATISPIDSPIATVSNFPSAGTYELIWTTTDGCSDLVSIEVDDNCDCPIIENIIDQPNPSEYCGMSPVLILNGTDAMPAGGTYRWEYSFNAGPFGAAQGTSDQRDYTTVELGVGEHVFRRVYAISSPMDCADESNEIVIIVYEEADAGADQVVVCFEDGVAQVTATGEGSWTWNSTPIANIVSSGNASTEINGFPEAGTYELLWTSDDGCTDLVVIEVGDDCFECDIMDNSIAQPAPSEYCNESEAVLIAGSDASPNGGSYTWEYSLNGGAYTNAPQTNDQRDYTTELLGPGEHRFRRRYQVSADPLCEDVSNEIIIRVEGPFHAGEDREMGCVDLAQTALTMAAQGNGSWTQSLTNPGTISISDLNDGTAVFSGFALEGSYTFIWSNNVCQDEVTITLQERLDAGADQTVACFIDGSATLSAQGQGSWSIGSNNPGVVTFSSLTDPNPTLKGFTINGIYEFIWTANGCDDIVQVVVGDSCPCIVEANAIIDDVPNVFCETTGDLMVIGEEALPAGGTYLWQISIKGSGFADAPGINDGKDYDASNLGEGQYILRRQYSLFIDGVECSELSNEIDFYVFDDKQDPGEIYFTPNPVCLGDSLILEVDYNPNLTYNWEVMSGSGRVLYALDSMSMIVVESPGVITVSVTQYLEGCNDNIVSTASSINITVLDSPKPNLGRDTTFCELEETFTIYPGDFVEYEWHDGSTDEDFLVDGEGFYAVTVIDTMGCEGTDAVHVKSFCCEFAYPNIIKADSYNGNGIFKVTDMYDCVIEAELQVYDRWGNLVYIGNGLESWDGTFNGKFVEQGVYAFIYKYTALDADREEFEDNVHGDITVIR